MKTQRRSNRFKVLTAALCALLMLTTCFIFISAEPTAEPGTAATTPTVTFEVTGGQGSDYANLYDNDLATKYCIKIKDSSGKNNPYVTFKASDAGTIVNGYTLTTGDDTETHAGRNPKNWTLYGSPNGNDWTEIHAVTGDTTLEAKSKTAYHFTFTNTAPYRYYKFDFTARQGADGTDNDLMQLSEIAFSVSGVEEMVKEVRTADDLTKALALNGATAKLMADVTVDQDIEIYQTEATLDLNGYVLTLSSNHTLIAYGAAPQRNSILRLCDSRPGASHTNAALPLGGVLQGKIQLTRLSEDETWENKAWLYGNGGSVTGIVKADTKSAGINCENYQHPTAFYEDVTGSNGSAILGGIYYKKLDNVAIDGSCYTVTFQNGANTCATEIVKKGKVIAQPIAPTQDGQILLGWSTEAGLLHDFSTPIKTEDSADMILAAKWITPLAVATFEELKTAIEAGTSVKLTADIELTQSLSISDGKVVLLDLNGYVLSENKNKTEIQLNGSAQTTRLIVVDSRPTAAHTNAELPTGGYLNARVNMQGNYSKLMDLYANGGTIKSVYANTQAGDIYWSEGTPSVIQSRTGYVAPRGGIYYFNCPIKNDGDNSVKKITFMDGDKVYAVEGLNFLSPSRTAYEPTAPVKQGCRFDGWYLGNAKFDFATAITSDLTLTAKWTDVTAPTGELTIGENKYTDSKATVDFNTYKTAASFSVTAQDNVDASPKIAYFLSDKALTAEQLAAVTFTDYTKAVTLSKDGKYVIYVKLSDAAGNVTYLSSGGFVLDKTAPSVTGISSDETYCEDQTLTISDENLASVKVNGVDKTADLAAGKLTLTPGATDQVIVVTDHAGNSTTVTLKFAHHDTDNDHICNVCSQKASDHDFGTWIAEQPADCTNTGTKAHKDCSVCKKHFAEDGTEITDLTLAVVPSAHKFGTLSTEVPADCTNTGTKAHKDCSVCNKHFDAEGNEITDLTLAVVPSAHKFGTLSTEIPADCTNTGTKAHKDCSICKKHFDAEGNELTDLTLAVVPSAHKFGTLSAEVPADCTNTGTKAHKDCSICNKHFDAEGNEITNLTIAIDPSAHKTEWSERIEPTEESEGTVAHATCTLCGKHFDADGNEIADLSIPKLEGGLSGGAIAGIAVGGVAVAGVGSFSVIWFVIKKKSFAELLALIKK